MKSMFLRLVALVTLAASLGTVIPISASAYSNVSEVKIDGFDCNTSQGKVIVYPNDTNETRVIKANVYNFRYTKLMVFDADGRIIEAGGDMFENSDTVTGSPQESVNVPAGGFLVAFQPGAVPELRKAYETAMEGAMLYNATMSVIYDVRASYKGDTLKIEYDNKRAPSASAKKYLIVGNSATYFNGTPIKFKGLAKAAGVEIDVDYSTFGSSYLSEFADENHERGKFLRNKLNTKKYDYVVLQDAGSATYLSTKPAVKTLLPLIEANGAEALLYMRYSASSTLETRLEGAKTHNENYSKLAEEYSLLCAPAADAFCICYGTNPEINLYADDNSHHSKEGSYLIACVWLQTYLGIDPRGNSYTAQLDDMVAKRLQEIAYQACTEGYEYPKGPEKAADTFTDKKGNIYKNIAEGKPYTVEGKPYSNAQWTDSYDDGTNMGKLTNGNYASEGDDNEVGAYSGSSNHSVTIDLGNIATVRAIKTDFFGNESWGIPSPSDCEISVSISNDGIKFMDIGKAIAQKTTKDGNWERCDHILELGSPVNARYVRLSYSQRNFYWASEISVYGESSANDTPRESEAVSENNETQAPSEENNKKMSWLYWLIGGLAVVATAGTAIFISKKKK